MLRTFGSNPGLGGFGNESTFRGSNDSHVGGTPDAFCQILKELVDNAVDACSTDVTSLNDMQPYNANNTNNTNNTAAKRVRVVIEPFTSQKDNTGITANELLKVTISDNGCGMQDINTCVGAFNSSKVDNTNASTEGKCDDEVTTSNQPTEGDEADTTAGATQTAGRYGIGLTLCLLHAQRLVPNSCASIQSATSSDQEWKVVTVVVDTASDAVRCFPRRSIPKHLPTESGTAVSILVPVCMEQQNFVYEALLV
jgi:Histidine kinase-, DNA gyrase B-, and HSP90-like ATPase